MFLLTCFLFLKVTIQILELDIALFLETLLLKSWRVKGDRVIFSLGISYIPHCSNLYSLYLHMQSKKVEQGKTRNADIQRLSEKHLFKQPTCGPSSGLVELHLVQEANSTPGGGPTCQLTVGSVPLKIRADTFWHKSLEHFFNLMAEQDLRWRDEETGKKKMQWALLDPDSN